jgi:flagellar hook-basal body complex protein FliE
MSIEAITATYGLATSAPLPTPAAQQVGTGFATLVDQIADLNQQMQTNEITMQNTALGGGTDNLHQVMLQMESARLQFDLLLQVRNKVMDAYQQLLSMQV